MSPAADLADPLLPPLVGDLLTHPGNVVGSVA